MAVSPWPGKCFAHPITLYSANPSISAEAIFPTISASSPYERNPITGLLALLLTSTTGANVVLIPKELNSLPIISPAILALFTSPVAPNAIFPGKAVPDPKR